MIKVLIVDDSKSYCHIIEQSLLQEKNVEILGVAHNGMDALEFIEKKGKPDLITLDLEMPEMDGLETLRNIQRLNEIKYSDNPIGVIIVSSISLKGAEVTIKALEMGAFDFVTKPLTTNTTKNMESLQRQLLIKIRTFITKKILSSSKSAIARRYPDIQNEIQELETPRNINNRLSSEKKNTQREEFVFPNNKRKLTYNKTRVIIIGVSTGGPKVLLELIPEICKITRIPIVIVQHMPPKFTTSLAQSVGKRCTYPVIEVDQESEIPLLPKQVYLAPGGKHLYMRKGEGGLILLGTNTSPPENGCRPAVDVLLRSAAKVTGGETLFIVLTGMGSDGTKGYSLLNEKGAVCIAQDKESSVVWGMPGSIVKAGFADYILTIQEIPELIRKITGE